MVAKSGQGLPHRPSLPKGLALALERARPRLHFLPLKMPGFGENPPGAPGTLPTRTGRRTGEWACDQKEKRGGDRRGLPGAEASSILEGEA